MTANPLELWAEIVTVAAERAVVHEKIDADLDTLPADPPEKAIGAHLQRCADLYTKQISLGGQIGVLIDLMAKRGLIEEIGAFLAVTYAGRA